MSLTIRGLFSLLAVAPDSRFNHELSQQAAKNAEAIDQVWRAMLLPAQNGGPASGSLYHLLTSLGLYLAVGTLILFIVQWARNLINNDLERPLTDLIWPIVIMALLAHQGYLLAQTTIGIRYAIHSVNNGLLEILDQSLKVEARLADMYNYRTLEEAIDDIRHECDPIVSDMEKLKGCKQQSEIKLNQLADEFNSLNRNGQEHTYYNAGQQKIAAARIALTHTPNLADPIPRPSPRDRALEKISASLLNLGQAFQRTLESCMVITAILGPLAVGASLTPFGTKPLFAWLSAFLGLGLAKLSYNLLVAIAISSFYVAGEQNFLFQDLVNGALNPLVAFGVASGGGKAIFESLISASPVLRLRNYGNDLVPNAVSGLSNSNPSSK
ncbi:hypothetical protein BST81_12800 [Leptolyngbya sp. 'hensonii']|uniref:hypothetical protein n=1 Tax=Leptolyngbya sp. 'hensonii' TaxID=1922337 RepID=UPI00094FB144|nr:hypothetical protein [Leptolyngbya sp. 'hensonii']OLP17929.1 hypothetical protein BST81_12800 [Leptolyngbya sp. 'hensonii']